MAFFDKLKGRMPTTKPEGIKNLEHLTEELEDVNDASFFLDGLKNEIKTYIRGRGPAEAVDAFLKIYVSPDRMTAYICAFEPKHEGMQITEDAIWDELKYEGITCGIKDNIVKRIVDEELYYRIIVIAEGTPPMNGKDGSILELIERKDAICLDANERNIVDFKNLGHYISIKKGKEICTIMPAEKGIDGNDIFGRLIPSEDGTPAIVPQGKNTILNNDRTALVADIDGSISFSKNVFSIDEMKVVDGNLDDLDETMLAQGDLLITGDVLDGVQIFASGNVIIGGTVGSADIESGGTIRIYGRMDGKETGRLKAHADIQGYCIENTNVTAVGNIYADIVSNCVLISENSLYVKGGKGLIVGGTINVAKCVEAKRIGNQSKCQNLINLAYSADSNDNVEYIEQQLRETEETLRKVSRHVSSTKALPNISQDTKEVLKSLEQQKVLYDKQQKELSARLQKVQEGWYGCNVRSEQICPVTSIKLGTMEVNIQTEMKNCNIRYSQGNLIKETYNVKNT